MVDKSLNSAVYIQVLTKHLKILLRVSPTSKEMGDRMAKNKSPTSAEIKRMASGFDRPFLVRLSYEDKRYSTIGINGIAHKDR